MTHLLSNLRGWIALTLLEVFLILGFVYGAFKAIGDDETIPVYVPTRAAPVLYDDGSYLRIFDGRVIRVTPLEPVLQGNSGSWTITDERGNLINQGT